MQANRFRFDESWEIPNATPEEVWAVLADGKLLTDWWGDVYREAVRITPGDEPAIGVRYRALARGFLPYYLRFVLEVVELEPGRSIAVRTTGDFNGLWRAVLTPKGAGTHVDLTWEVVVERPLLRRLSPLLRPAFAWNHRWTTPRGEAGLCRYFEKVRAPAVTSIGSGGAAVSRR